MLHPSILHTEYDMLVPPCPAHFVRWGMDHDHIRARVFAQWGNSEDDLEWAVRSCPVDSWMAVGCGRLVRSCHEMRLSGSFPRKNSSKIHVEVHFGMFWNLKNHPHCSSVLYSRWYMLIRYLQYLHVYGSMLYHIILHDHITFDIIWHHMISYVIILYNTYDIILHRIGVYDMMLNHVISCNIVLYIRFYFMFP